MGVKTFRVVSVLFMSAAIAMFLYATFISHDSGLRGQGIWWFLIALGCALVPAVSRFKFQDLEVEFQRKIDRVERTVFELRGALQRAVERTAVADSQLSPHEMVERNQYWDEFSERMNGMEPAERLEVQRDNSLRFLGYVGMSVQQVKEHLAELNVYSGEPDEAFTAELAAAVERFQRSRNMRHVDGMLGQLTIRELSRALTETRERRNDKRVREL